MFDEASLLDKLAKIEALHAGATSDGERIAAAVAAERIRQRLADLREVERDMEMHYSLPDPWMRQLFVALCRRYGLVPFRRPRQRASTICVMLPEAFHRHTLWPEFVALSTALRHHLQAITERVIHIAVHQDTTDAAIAADPKQLPGS